MMSENENESIESIVAIVRMAAQYYDGEAEKSEGLLRETFKLSAANYREIADRTEAAWKREREELDKRISDLEAYAKLWTDRADELRLKCDEFYAKAKPFGNAAAMREALLEIETVAGEAIENGTIELPQYSKIVDIARAALAAPARNCDRFADETDAQIAFLNEVWLISVTKETALERDRFENWTDEMRSRYAKWLLSPAEKGGAE